MARWSANAASPCASTGRKAVPIPELLYPSVLGRFGFARLPRASISHVKYPVVVDASPFWKATGFKPAYDEVQVMDAFRWR